MSLRETLQKMEETEKASGQEIDVKLKEWREVAIAGLYRSVKENLSDLITDGLVRINPCRTERRTEEMTRPLRHRGDGPGDSRTNHNPEPCGPICDR